jgi:para-aminobenzoate synthetase component I
MTTVTDLDLATALARIADAPVIACLVGEAGATLVWQNSPQLAEAMGDTSPLGAHGEAHASEDCGRTWGQPPIGAQLVQCDYEWPKRAPLVIPVTQGLRWDARGGCSAFGDEPAIAAIHERLSRPRPTLDSARLAGQLQPAWSEVDHVSRVDRIRDWIAAGDCYQVNLAVAFQGRIQAQQHHDLATFLALHQRSPAPFAAFFRAPGRASVISHSPECFLAARGETLVSVPIKGTRRRRLGEDDVVRAELRASAKDVAELAMIVDLVRNDLGRVAHPGSVRVADGDVILDLDYVHHRAARVVARRRDGIRACMDAAFPAGSITGAPKIRAMQIIAELEDAPRGPAYGTFGWIGPQAWDLAVAIRTATITGDALTLHAGGGIVWDSDGVAEWREAHAKAAGFARALGSDL